MTCGLNNEELFILNLLYSKRNLSSRRGYHRNKLELLFSRRFNDNFKIHIRRLLNEGYIAQVGKSPPKYYIADIRRTFFALGNHGYNVSKGRERPL